MKKKSDWGICLDRMRYSHAETNKGIMRERERVGKIVEKFQGNVLEDVRKVSPFLTSRIMNGFSIHEKSGCGHVCLYAIIISQRKKLFFLLHLFSMHK